MSEASDIQTVLDRSMNDEKFLQQFNSDPEAALAEMDVSEEAEESLKAEEDGSIYDYLDSLNMATVYTITITYVSRKRD
ncbi:hypothetical protein RYH80_06100 [Halobaculum sp. MBLA0147]|uniref:hypothetical protein n=1 Tax=Halobaculum sp. MBLA0147 TaxID=3079934 RepID=UPI003523858E